MGDVVKVYKLAEFFGDEDVVPRTAENPRGQQTPPDHWVVNHLGSRVRLGRGVETTLRDDYVASLGDQIVSCGAYAAPPAPASNGNDPSGFGADDLEV